MRTSRDGRRVDTSRPGRRANDLPVLQWLLAGAATAGVGVAIVATPSVAGADTGDSSSARSDSLSSSASSGSTTSPNELTSNENGSLTGTEGPSTGPNDDTEASDGESSGSSDDVTSTPDGDYDVPNVELSGSSDDAASIPDGLTASGSTSFEDGDSVPLDLTSPAPMAEASATQFVSSASPDLSAVTIISPQPVSANSVSGETGAIEPAPPPYSTIPVGMGPTGVVVRGNTAYVTNRSSNTLSLIDTVTNAEKGEIRVRTGGPLAVTTDGSRAFTTVSAGMASFRVSRMYVVNAVTQKAVANVRLEGWATGIAVSGDATKVYVVTDRWGESSKLTVINATTGKILSDMDIQGNPNTVVVDPVDGNKVYISQASGLGGYLSSVQKIDTVNETVVDEYKTDRNVGLPNRLAVSSDSKTIYVGVGSNVVAINAASKKTSKLVVGNIWEGERADSLALSADGKTLLVTTSNPNLGGLTVINIGAAALDGAPTMTIAATIKAGRRPAGVAFSSNGLTAYVADSGGGIIPTRGVVSVVNIKAFKVSSSAAVGATPVAVATSPTKDRAYVVNEAGSVSVINTSNNDVIHTITKGLGSRPTAVAVSRDGARAYVTFRGTRLGSSGVSVINTESNTVLRTLSVGTNPTAVAITPDGKTLYATFSGGIIGSAGVSKIDIATGAAQTVASADKPSGVAISPDGSWAYVSNEGSNTVTMINTQTGFIKTVRVGSSPMALALTPSGDKVIVVNRGTNPFPKPSISIIETDNLKVETITAANSGKPNKVAVSPDGQLAYITNTKGTVTVVDLESNDPLVDRASIKTGGTPTALAISPNGGTVYVTNVASNNLWILGGAQPT